MAGAGLFLCRKRGKKKTKLITSVQPVNVGGSGCAGRLCGNYNAAGADFHTRFDVSSTPVMPRGTGSGRRGRLRGGVTPVSAGVGR